MELILLVLALFFVWKIFIQNVPEKRVAVILPESGDQRWDSLIKGMKQSAKENHIHLVICNTDDIENAEAEKEAIEEQKNNHIDAFIVLPAPGTDTKEMLTKECSDVPVILVVEDLYTEDAEATSKFSVVAPDYYEMGKYIGGQINSRKQTIGIVVGRKDTEAAASAVRGLTDALEGSDCQILWHYYQEKDQDVCEKVKEQPKVDTLVVLDPGALDQLGDQFEETQEETQEEAQEETQEQGAGTKIYGIGSSMKAIALQDYGKTQGLVVLDGYEIGYKSVEEIAKKIKNRLYKMESHETEVKIMDQDTKLLDDEIERFLCISGCGSGKIKSDKVLRVGVVTYTQDDPFINALADKLKENLKSMETEDMKITVSVKNGNDDQQDQNDIVEEMIDAGCDVLCVNLVDRTAPSRIIRLAKQNDIPIIFFNREPVWEDLMQWEDLYYVGCDAEQSGVMQGEIAADYIKNHPEVDKNQDGEIQYVLLEGEAGHQDAISRTDFSVKTLIEKEVNLEKLSYQFADWNRGQAENRMNRLISQYKDGIELVISNNDEMALGAVEAYRKAGYEQAEWPVIFGIDGLDDALEAIKAGEMQGTVYNDKEDQALQIAKLAVEIFRGEDVNRNKLKEGRYYVSEYQPVYSSNVEDFIKRQTR